MASLTKIMTSFVVLNLIEKFSATSQWAHLSTSIKILRPVSQINGTSACLLEGDTLSIRELMYGMMLPSGNDAATALGIHFGAILRTQGQKDPEIIVSDEAIDRRLKAVKMVMARDHKDEQERKRRQLEQLMAAEEGEDSAAANESDQK